MAMFDAAQPGTERAAMIARIVRMAVMAVVAVAVLRFFWTYGTLRVQDWNDQMSPTLAPGDKALVHKGIRTIAQLGCGELIVYRVGNADGVTLRVGRIAAMPGDTVEVRPGGREVRVNGVVPAHAPVLLSAPEAREGAEAASVTRVPERAVYVLNDNLASELADSRKLGPIDEAAVAGKVVMSLMW